MSLTLDGSLGAYVVRATLWEGHLRRVRER